jgi:uncharacterized protein YbbC (DUF1343 family)
MRVDGCAHLSRPLRPRLILALLTFARATEVSAGVDGGSTLPPEASVGGDGLVTLAEGIDRLVGETIAQGKLPGCVVAIGNADGVLYQKAFGSRALLPEREAMTVDTIFDVASLTKPVATAMSIVALADRGKVDLDEAAAHYVPEFRGHGKERITLRQLLTHVSGLPVETPLTDFERGRPVALARIFALSPKSDPGERFLYSDVGFLVLEEVIRRVTGLDLATFAQSAVFLPLGMRATGFLPAATLRARIAPTEKRNDTWMRGEVHDPRAFRLGGVAGHAGLFSTASDLARFARMVLGSGALEGARVLSLAMLGKMLAPHDVPGGIRALGWDVQSTYSSTRGLALSRRAVGHTGYTGTSLWIDPERNLFVVFLSNRVHPDGKGAVLPLAAAIATLAGTTLSPVPVDPPAFVLGIDVLAAQNFSPLRGLRIALLTNDSARARDGRRTTDLLAVRRDFSLVALLSPEHGLGAVRDERIEDGIDSKTHLPVASLYGGALSLRRGGTPGPRPITLPPDIEAVVVDLPDVGARFFTYASTVHAVLRSAAERGLKVIVLDRPNPIGATEVSGPLLKASEMSAVNHHPLPVRHGMTMGELAEMMNADEHLGTHLQIIRMAAYDRHAYLDELGVPFAPPSPNLRSLDEVLLYPGTALLESTNVSVGRGTDTPFEVVGAPWIASAALAPELGRFGLGGVTFEATTFTPEATPYRGRPCHGVRLRISDRTRFDPVRTGLAIAIALRKLHAASWDDSRLRRMLGDPAVAQAIHDGRKLADIEALYKEELERFRSKRAKYLLYPP